MRGSPLPDYVAMALQQVSTLLHRKPMRKNYLLYFTFYERCKWSRPKNALILYHPIKSHVLLGPVTVLFIC